MWPWIAIGLGIFLALSLVVGIAVAAVLGAIGRQISVLHSELDETDEWAVLPPARATDGTEQPAPTDAKEVEAPASRRG